MKLSQQKLAAVCTHIGKELGRLKGDTNPQQDVVMVLAASDKKFEDYKDYAINYKEYLSWVHVDHASPDNTEVAVGWIEN